MAFKENYKLRTPSGKHTVGCTQFEYEYNSVETKKKRRIPCLCFYPSNAKDALGRPKKYASDKLFPEMAGITTNSYWDIPILPGKHPLLLFSTGLGSSLEQNTVQFEELASNGYIILSIGHEGSSSFELENGELCVWESMEEYQEEISSTQEEAESYIRWLTESNSAASIQEQQNKYQSFMNSRPFCAALLDIWVKDSLVALDMLLESVCEKSEKIRSHMDSNKIAAFGMSFGGSTAHRLTVESELIKAGVSMDGRLYWSANWDGTINKPFLLMYRDDFKVLSGLLPSLSSTGDFYPAEIKDCSHVNFTDYNDILETDERGFLGPIDPDIMERIMNTLLLDFFNKYFRNEPSKYLDTNFWKEHVTVSKK